MPRRLILVLIITLAWAGFARAHPLVNGRIDVVIAADKIDVDAQVSMEEVLVSAVGNNPRPPESQWPELVKSHGAYLLRHLKVRVDGAEVPGHEVGEGELQGDLKDTALVKYHLEYPLAAQPREVKIDQNLLREYENWAVSLVVRIRQADQTEWENALLTSDKTVAYDAAPPKEGLWGTIWSFLKAGIKHILEGKDHLLFVSALVLVTTGFWDLIKVVSAFTLAHTVTLTLAVFNLVRVSEHIVEPMIAASIVFVAVQNIFWPKRSHGGERLAIAFGFGLFHGLGFAGGLKDAMQDMPPATLWAALLAFSVGVELGHQFVVIPLFSVLTALRHVGTERPRVQLMRHVITVGSIAISVGGTYFLFEALRSFF